MERSSRALQYQLVLHKLTIAVAAGDNRSSRGSIGLREPRAAAASSRVHSTSFSRKHISVYDEIYGVIRHMQRVVGWLILNPILEL